MCLADCQGHQLVRGDSDLLDESFRPLSSMFQTRLDYLCGLGAEVADKRPNLPFVLPLVVITIEYIAYLIDVRKSPAGLRKVQHLPLNIRQRNTF